MKIMTAIVIDLTSNKELLRVVAFSNSTVDIYRHIETKHKNLIAPGVRVTITSSVIPEDVKFAVIDENRHKDCA